MAPLKSAIIIVVFCLLMKKSEQINIVDAIVKLGSAIGSLISTTVMGDCDAIQNLLGLKYNELVTNKETPEKIEKELYIEFYTSRYIFRYNFTMASKTLLLNPYFNKTKPTVMYVLGWMMIPSYTNTASIVQSLVKRGDVNVLLFDVSKIAFFFYLYASALTSVMGTELGIFLNSLFLGGVSNNNIHLVGHSLGAHIAGFAGRAFYNKTGLKIARITGLDPAGPCFFMKLPDYSLMKTDANFVNVIHTDSGLFGINRPIGHADFWPNGGSAQPGALGIAESHGRSWQLFNESIYPSLQLNLFAVQCSDWTTFKSGSCNNNPAAYLGLYTHYTARGNYYLTTASSRPFGLGVAGITATTCPWESFMNWLGNILGV